MFYLKYRPKSLEEIDLESVRESLRKVLLSKELPHAFLFQGPKGVGKTSAARILAKILNCERREESSVEPCNKCEQCKLITEGTNLDVIELDAASHRGIDDVRALKELISLSPMKAKKKVYIIDEAHMLTLEASNALLKTLEEPPSHVVFILATTNPEKILPTIRSRTFTVVFRKPKIEEIVRSLERVVNNENIKADRDLLFKIAEIAGGSFRDAHKILEQILGEDKKLSEEKLREFYLDLDKRTEKIILFMIGKDEKKAIEEVRKAVDDGVEGKDILDSILRRLQSALHKKVGLRGEDLESIEKDQLVSLIELLLPVQSKIRDSFIQELPLEVAIVRWCRRKDKDFGFQSEFPQEGKKTNEKEVQEFTTLPVKDLKKWEKLIAEVKSKNVSVEALLKAAQPLKISKKELVLGVYYSFHKERLEDIESKRLLDEVASRVFGKRLRVVFQLISPQKKFVDELKKEGVVLTQVDAKENKDIIEVAKEVFGE